MKRAQLLAGPYLLGLVVLVAIPAAAAVWLSLNDFAALTAPRFVGLANFVDLVTSSSYWRSLGDTAVYVAIAVPLRLVAATVAALLLQRHSRAIAAERTAVYLPSVVPDVAYALLWLWLLNPLYGPLALSLPALGVASPDWLTDPWPARVAIAVMGALQIGEAFVVALIARRSVPESLYEAAELERARPWFTLTRVTLPLMAPLLALLALRDVVLALQANFVPALLVTDGGPRYATTYLALLAYRAAFRYFRFGYASAVSVTMFVLTAAVLALQYRVAKRYKLI